MRNLPCLLPVWICRMLLLALATASSATASPLLLSAPVYKEGHFTFSIQGESKAGYFILSSTNLSDWTTIAMNSSYASTRAAEVPAPAEQTFFKIQEVPESRFRFGLAAKGSIQLAGNVLIDSYDSSNPLYSSNGFYTASKQRDHGDVASDGQLVNEINSGGTVEIYGHISTGPGGSVALSAYTSIGENAWVDGGNIGIEPGWFTDDMNIDFPDVAAPFNSGGFWPSGGIVGGTIYTYVLSSGKYQASSISMNNSNKMLITGNAVLYVAGDFKMFGSSALIIAPGASLKLYVGGTNAVFNGGGIMNGTGFATNFIYYGMATNTLVSLGGSAFTGMIYAPRAALNVAGGTTIYGATVSSSVTAPGGFVLHYDESLASASWLR